MKSFSDKGRKVPKIEKILHKLILESYAGTHSFPILKGTFLFYGRVFPLTQKPQKGKQLAQAPTPAQFRLS